MLQNKPSKKGGRHAKSLAEKRKYRLSLKLNTSEYLQLKSKSKIAGKNRCDFLRELIFSSEIKQQFSKEQNEIFRQITGMANNLNQLVKLAHVQSVWYIEVTAKKLLDDLDAAKIVKGSSFSGAVGYMLSKKEKAEILKAEGVRTEPKELTVKSFELQASMNPNIKKPVWHISLNFPRQDKDKLTNDKMIKIAEAYLQKMDIRNTQYLIVRH